MKLRKLTALLVATLILSGCSQNGADKATNETETKVEETKKANTYTGTVNIVHVNDVHTYVQENEKTIGYGKAAGYVEALKAENPNTIFMDNGDTFSGSELAAVDKSESLIPILNTVGFDVMVTGNHDFSFGTSHLLKFADELNYPVLCANMIDKESQKPILDEYLILELDNGMKMGVIGLTTPTSATMGAVDLEYVDAIATANRLVGELEPQVDIIVGLCHVGDTDGDPLTSDMIAEQVPGLDVIVDGHSHTMLPEGKVVNGVLIGQTGEYGQNLGLIELVFENGELVDKRAKLITKEESAELPERAETAQLVNDLAEKSEAFLSEEIGATSVELVGTKELLRSQETNMGDLYADVMTEYADAELGLFLAGPIGGELQPGPITRRDLVAMARVNSLIVATEVTGADIVEFINHSLSSYPTPSGLFLQISGISYVLDPEATENKAFDIKINGEPIELDRVYTLATIIGATESPGLSNGKIVRETKYSMDILAEYIEANSPISYDVDGRISTGTKSE